MATSEGIAKTFEFASPSNQVVSGEGLYIGFRRYTFQGGFIGFRE